MKPHVQYVMGLTVLLTLCFGSAGAEQDPVVTIDAGKTGAPISKYVYGQFIEHLGRCIDGGVWAEMLHDRKFYFPIKNEFRAWSDETADGPVEEGTFLMLVGSPWQKVGIEEGVVMTRENACSGEYNVAVRLKGDGSVRGIEQDQLGVVAGTQYSGRIVLAGNPEAAPIEVSLTWSENGRDTAVIETVSRDFETYRFNFTAGKTTDNAALEGDGRMWWITGPDPMAYNEPGKEPQVRIHERALTGVSNRLDSPPYSASVYSLNVGP